MQRSENRALLKCQQRMRADGMQFENTWWRLAKLPAVLVDRLHERGLVFADDHQNAVFVRHSLTDNTWVRGEVTGASLRGTWGEDNHYHGLAPGSARDQGWFWIGTGNGPVRRVLLTESPIDAMSLALLDKERRGSARGNDLSIDGRLGWVSS